MNTGRMFTVVFALVFSGLAGLTLATAQAPTGIKRTIIQKTDVPGTNLEAIFAVVEIAANFKAGRHSHPGKVIAYVTEGEFFITFDGQPEKQFKVGDSVVVPGDAVHDEGTKSAAAKLHVIYMLEKGRPLASPAK